MVKSKYRSYITEGPIFTKMLTFSIPIILTGVLQVVYNMADNIVVGRWSGDQTALGAVGSTSAITTFLTNFMLSLSAGAGVVIAQLCGARNDRDVERAVHTSMAMSLIGGIAFAVLGLSLTRPLLILTGTQDVFMENAVLYMRIICVGIPATAIYNFGAAILRSAGDSRTSLYVLSVSGIVNVLLNFLFVCGFGMSVAGVAIATIVSQYISAIAVVVVLIRRHGVSYRLNVKKLRLERHMILRILRIGIPMAFQSALFSISNILVSAAVNTFPPEVVSAKTIAFNIEGITYTAMSGFSQAAMTFMGQNYGAGKLTRLNKILFYSLVQVTAVGILISQTEILLGRPISNMYLDPSDPGAEPVVEAVLEIFKIMLATYFLCGIMDVLSGILKSLGYSTVSMIMCLVGLAVRVLWLTLVTPTERFHTIFGLFVSYTISWAITIILLLIACAVVWRRLGIGFLRKKDSDVPHFDSDDSPMDAAAQTDEKIMISQDK